MSDGYAYSGDWGIIHARSSVERRGNAYLKIHSGGHLAHVHIPSSEAPALAQAVLDAAGVTNALVLTDLPKVERKASGRWHEFDVAGTRYTIDLDETVDEVRETGLAYLAIARWLGRNTVQPDPQVEKLARLVREAEDEHPENAMVDYERIARALIEAGVKVEVDE